MPIVAAELCDAILIFLDVQLSFDHYASLLLILKSRIATVRGTEALDKTKKSGYDSTAKRCFGVEKPGFSLWSAGPF
jgi:hypothetical protein